MVIYAWVYIWGESNHPAVITGKRNIKLAQGFGDLFKLFGYFSQVFFSNRIFYGEL